MPIFITLWNNHPHVKGEKPLLDLKGYENQCAINLSAALLRSGVNMKNYPGQWSWEKDKPKYAIRAQELADWLAVPSTQLPMRVQKFTGKNVFDKISGKSGIVFFQHYWGPAQQGNHIDLFNGSRMTELSSWARIHLYLSWEGSYSSFRHAESAWFWPLP